MTDNLGIMDIVNTPDGKKGKISEFDTNGAGEVVAKVYIDPKNPRWYRVSELTKVV